MFSLLKLSTLTTEQKGAVNHLQTAHYNCLIQSSNVHYKQWTKPADGKAESEGISDLKTNTALLCQNSCQMALQIPLQTLTLTKFMYLGELFKLFLTGCSKDMQMLNTCQLTLLAILLP